MEESGNQENTRPRNRVREATRALVIYVLSLFISLPLFVIVHPYVPAVELPIGNGFRVDHFLTLICLLLVSIAMVRQFEVYAYALSLVGVGVLCITTISGKYGFADLYADYASFLTSLSHGPVEVPFLAADKGGFLNAEDLVAATNYREEAVRNFAVEIATKHFDRAPVGQEEITLVQCLSIFKEINSHWKYVSDPIDGEYFAKASESMVHFAGDCDDHAVLMAACIKAVGGEVRFVRTTGHIYPELKIGDEAAVERATNIITRMLFIRETRGKELYHHTDSKGDHWINLDYTRNFPGGEFIDEDIIGVQKL